MNVPVVGVFGLRSGTGKTTLIYHLAWMCSELGIRTVAVDLDPQCGLTEHVFGAESTDTLMREGKTIYSCIEPWKNGSGDLAEPPLHVVNDRLAVVAGSVDLLDGEDFAKAWRECTTGDAHAMQGVAAIARITQQAAAVHGSQLVLVDLGSSISPLNRVAFVGITHVIMPIISEPLALRSLEMVGAALAVWRDEWKDRQPIVTAWSKEVPERSMLPIGYVLLSVPTLGRGPTQAPMKLLTQVPTTFYHSVLGSNAGPPPADSLHDPMCLPLISQYVVLFPMAAELNKPVFDLKPADGAMGSIMAAAQRARQDFEHLARTILSRVSILPA